MAIYALVRVSDEHKQSSDTQVHAIKSYCRKNNLKIDQWYEFELSGTLDRDSRGITKTIDILKLGDHLLTTDLPRLGRQSVSDLMEIALRIINQGATLHFCYSNETLTPADQNNPTKLFLTLAESFAAWRFAAERSQKAKHAIERRKQAGLHNGRKAGSYVKSKLDQHEQGIISMKNDKISENSIAEHYNVDRTTLRTWLKRRDEVISKSKEQNLWELGLSLSELKQRLNKLI